ncbi:MAG: hypothetical protein NTW97_00785, partial [Candidatus Krumholzibacteria bacterium]|nr:hypothetical protein [Candidatus Krumholzibacteria bacterium]
SLSLFYKRLREIDPREGGFERKQSRLAGASLDLDLRGNLGAGLGWLEKKSWPAAGNTVDTYRRGIVASLRRDFGRAGVLRLQYERIRNDEPALGGIDTADLYSLYSSIEF